MSEVDTSDVIAAQRSATDGRREDLVSAMQQVPQHVRQDLEQSAECLDLVDSHLPAGERILQIASASGKWSGVNTLRSVLLLTDSRLVFVNSSPQVVAWRLADLTKSQAIAGSPGEVKIFFVEDRGGGEFQLGIDGAWGKEFQGQVERGRAIAVLSGR